MTEKTKTFKEIYVKYKNKFKEQVKEDFIDIVFNENKSNRKELLTKYTKDNIEPEPLTEDIIKEMLGECGIDPLDIKRQKVLTGVNDIFEKVRKKPDFYILNTDPDKKSLLFEIEHLNKDLEKVGDGEGIEQASEWYKIDPSFAFEYDSIITNFHEWFYLRYNPDNRKYECQQKKPEIMLEIITNIKSGMGREYLIDLEEQKREITTKFYRDFQERLKKLLGKSSSVKVDIKVLNFKKSDDQSQEEFENSLISFYRIIFSRLLFIKILKSWKMLKIDPVSSIFKNPKMYWNTELRALFFDVFNKKPINRPDYIIKDFKVLPYLNGGLFRPSGIEIDSEGNPRDVFLNPEAIKDIWDFLKGYNFIKEDSDTNLKDLQTINPEILGYIFERSIGDERKKTGSFYTPEELTDYMAENTIYSYVIEKINENFSDMLLIKEISDIDFLLNKAEIYNYVLNELIQNIKICDPACGSGAFLKKIADKLLFLYKKCYRGCGRELPSRVSEDGVKDSQMPFPDLYSIKKFIIQRNIFGVDINPSAIEICELRMWLWIVKPPEETRTLEEYLDMPPLPNIEYNLRCGNSLIGYYDIERLSEIGSDKFHRIDDKFLSKTGSAIIDILNQKQELISCYYKKNETIEESRKNEIRNAINTIIGDFQEQLNNLLKNDFQNQKIIIPIHPIYLSDYVDKNNFRKVFQDILREINNDNELVYFKIKFKKPVNIDYEAIRSVKGLRCSVNKDTKKVSSIYPTSKFNFKYYSEYGENPYSKFLMKQISDWSQVYNIEFKKKVDMKDIFLINPFYWVMEFPEIFANPSENNRGFDIIIGNPPFIRADTEDDFFLLQRNILIQLPEFETLWEKWDIFVAFIERCIKNLLKKNGKFAFVVSDAICTVKYAKRLRNWLQRNSKIPLLDYFEGYDVFKGVGINPILLFVVKNAEINYTKKNIHTNNFITISMDYQIDQDSEYLWKKYIPEILSFKLGRYEHLKNFCYISYGLRPNADEKIAKGEFKNKDLISDSPTEINKKMYIEGKNTSRYKIEKVKYLEWDTERCPAKIARKTFPELYLGKKMLRGRLTEGFIDLNDIINNDSIIVFRRFIDLKGVENKSINSSLSKNNSDKTREELEKISEKFTYEYLLSVINSKFGLAYLNAIRVHKLPNTFYPDDFRKFPIKFIEDQTFFVNLINIIQFLYQHDGNQEIIDFFDNKLLNFVIYEIYFEGKLKEAGFYQDLLEEIKDRIVEIEYAEWIKLKFKSSLNHEEQDEKNRIETRNIEIINEIYNSINIESVNKKIEKMKEFDWITKIEIN